ncbi:MAG: hypothetical protein METHAR1v1_1010008, partial [Methanothrix sp.]
MGILRQGVQDLPPRPLLVLLLEGGRKNPDEVHRQGPQGGGAVTAPRHPLLTLALSLALALLCGCLSADEPAAAPVGGKVKVVASTVPLGTFASMVGGDLVEVAVLVPPGASPHTFEPTPSKLAEVAEA